MKRAEQGTARGRNSTEWRRPGAAVEERRGRPLTGMGFHLGVTRMGRS